MIIGLTGRIASGKTTASDYLVENGFKEYSMAGPLKEIGRIFHFEKHQLYGSQEQKMEINKHWGISARHFLQKFGTDVCRNLLQSAIPDMKFGEENRTSIWIRLFEIERANNPNTNYVISDVRFLDEAECIKRMGGKLIRISRDVNTVGSEHMHPSELEMSKIVVDYIVDNNGSMEELYCQLSDICLDTGVDKQLSDAVQNMIIEKDKKVEK